MWVRANSIVRCRPAIHNQSSATLQQARLPAMRWRVRVDHQPRARPDATHSPSIPVADYEPPTRNVPLCRQACSAALPDHRAGRTADVANRLPTATVSSVPMRQAAVLRRRGAAPSAGGHRSASPGGPATAAAGSRPDRPGAVGERRQPRARRRRGAAPDAAATDRPARPRGRGRSLRLLQPWRANARDCLPGGEVSHRHRSPWQVVALHIG